MKVQIRRNVFETNSSSVHTLQISNKKIDDIKESVYERILEQYKDAININRSFDYDDYIIDNKFYLFGLSIEDGEECGNIYYIIENWIAKLQCIAMYIYSHIQYFPDFDDDSYENDYVSIYKYIENTDIIKWFKNEVIKYADIHDIHITEVVLDIKYNIWIDMFKNCNNPYNRNTNTIDVYTLKQLISEIMDDDYILEFQDEAYRPYTMPQIITI